MRKQYSWILSLLLFLYPWEGFSQNQQKKMEHKHTNHLIHENSPYLLQHAHNPVNWYPWGEEALQKAAKENKVILVSIGYAACHWCHVMERESFENEEVAKIMNEFFVCIKVDREERPDIDQIYMDAVQMMTGSGGWPLNCFATPDGKPFFGGTYFRPNDWVKVLQGVQNAWLTDREKVFDVAAQVSEGICSNEKIDVKLEAKAFQIRDLQPAFEKWQKEFDGKRGGMNRAPKFPLPNSLQFLLQYYFHTGQQSALDQVLLTLDKMAAGGIYDQIGGGFARYSVDAIWKVPHFEKMLYDNAQLVSLYSEAYSLTKNPTYKWVVEQTLAFVDRELSLPEGGFYSSLDADSEGVEGKYYVWEKSEIDELLGKNSPLFCEYFGVNATPNWEEGNILMVQTDKKQLAEKYELSEEEFESIIEDARAILLEYREKRVHPGLDDKSLTSWNALMIQGYIDAYKALGEESYLQRAQKAADFIEKKLLKGESHLHRNYKDGVSKINAFLDDYAFTIAAFIDLYQASFDEQYLQKANALMQQVLLHFSDEKTHMFFYTSDEDAQLIARKQEILDNVIPSSNSAIAKALYLLGVYLDREEYMQRAGQMLANMHDRLLKFPSYHSNWGQLFLRLADSSYEVVIVGDRAKEDKKKLEAMYLPNVIFAGSKGESDMPLLQNRYVPNRTSFYLCRNNACKLPVSSVDELIDQLKEELITKNQ